MTAGLLAIKSSDDKDVDGTDDEDDTILSDATDTDATTGEDDDEDAVVLAGGRTIVEVVSPVVVSAGLSDFLEVFGSNTEREEGILFRALSSFA